MFSQKHAYAIAKKLGCTLREGSAHTYADLYENGKLIVRIGIRRASKEKSHGHIPKNLNLSQKQSWDLHDCTLTKEEYLRALRDKNLLDESGAKDEKQPQAENRDEKQK